MNILTSIFRIIVMLSFDAIGIFTLLYSIEVMNDFNRIGAFLLFCLSGVFIGTGFLIGCPESRKRLK